MDDPAIKARVIHRVFVWSILHRTSTKKHVRIRANPKGEALVNCSGCLCTTQPCLRSAPVVPPLELENFATAPGAWLTQAVPSPANILEPNQRLTGVISYDIKLFWVQPAAPRLLVSRFYFCNRRTATAVSSPWAMPGNSRHMAVSRFAFRVSRFRIEML
jgi:hypothetical protein